MSIANLCLVVFLILASSADGARRSSTSSKSEKKSRSPTSAPTTLNSRRFLLCQYDACGNVLKDQCTLDEKKGKKGTQEVEQEVEEVLSEQTVGDAKGALEELGEAIDVARSNDDYELFKNVAQVLAEQGNLLWASSTALAVSPETGSEDQITQSVIQDAVRDTFAKSNQLLAETRQFFAAFRVKEKDPIIDQIMIRVSAITRAYSTFIESRNDNVDRRTKESALNKFRAACNADNFVPADMFKYIYGYACGDAVDAGAVCPEAGVGSLGVCSNGDKKENAFTRSFLNTANTSAKDDLESFGEFGLFLVGALSNLMLAHSICVPPEGNACSAEPDADFTEGLQEMKISFDEVVGNLNFVEDCVKSRPTEPKKDMDLALCSLSEEGFPVSEDSPDYNRGTPAYAQGVTIAYAEEVATDVTNTLTALVGGGADILGALEKASAFVAVLGGVGAGLSILTHFLSKSETDLTQELIKQQFDKSNEKLDALSNQVADGFSDLSSDLGDSRLDDLMGQLSVVRRAYDDFIYSRGNNTTSKSTKKKYTDEFRNACNNKAYKPQDIFRIFYGYACGKEINRSCDAINGFATGKCEYGDKQRQYLLDVFKVDSKGDAQEFRKFSYWLSSAMSEAMYLHTVCLDPDPNSCPTSIDNPILAKTFKDMSAAFNETAANLAAVESCCPCRRVTLTRVKTGTDEIDCESNFGVVSLVPNGLVEVAFTVDKKVVFDGNLRENSWRTLNQPPPFYHYVTGSTPAQNIEIEFTERDGQEEAPFSCAIYVAITGSRTVSGSDWFKKDVCEPYTMDFASNAGAEIGDWIFELKVEPGDMC